MEGYLYLLLHPDKPGVVKIGRTTRSPQRRLAEHNERGLLSEIAQASGKPWELIHYVPVTDASKAEAYVWEYLCVPKFGKIELHGMPLEFIMEALKACVYLDKEKYAAMLDGELREYNVSALLDSIRTARETEAAQRAAEKKRARALKAAETRRRDFAKKDI
jgi:predicted GIY-YIG superfamily endonuclease